MRSWFKASDVDEDSWATWVMWALDDGPELSIMNNYGF